MGIVRADDLDLLVDTINRYHSRDTGNDNDAVLIWRNNDAGHYILDVDNAAGFHANFGQVLLVQDSDIGAYTTLTMHQAHVLQFKNGADTNIANLYHSGTNDIIKSDDNIWFAGTVNAGSVTPVTAAGGFFGSGALNMGPTASATNAGEIYGSRGISVGTYSAPATGEVRASAAVGVGVVPTSPLHVSVSKASAFLAIVDQLNASAGAKGLEVKMANVTAADAILSIESGGVTRFAVFGDGSMQAKGGEALQKAPVGAVCSTLTTLSQLPTWTDLTGCSVPLSIGRWTLTGTLYIQVTGAGDVGQLALGRINPGTATATINRQTSLIVMQMATVNNVYQSSQQWDVQVTVAGTVFLQGAKSALGTGTTQAQIVHTTLTATYEGNI